MRRLGLAAAAIACAASTAFAQTPLGTSFTYQGRLEESGSPATGTYDFRFILYDAPAGGNQVGPIVTRDDVSVSTGLFTVGVDFGAVFGSQRRFLEVGVRPGASTGAYDVVSGRPELTAAPSALFGASAPWTGVTGKPAGFADDVDNDLLAGLVCTGAGRVAKWNGTIWTCDLDLNTNYTAGPGIQINGSAITIPSLGVANAMLADNAVTLAKMADNSVGTVELQNGAVTSTKIGSSAVMATNIADNAITLAKIGGSEVGLYLIPQGCVNGRLMTVSSPPCLSQQCGASQFYSCAGVCNQVSQQLCQLTLIGFLLSPSIP